MYWEWFHQVGARQRLLLLTVGSTSVVLPIYSSTIIGDYTETTYILILNIRLDYVEVNYRFVTNYNEPYVLSRILN